jgi:hypothetical protein
VCHCTRSRGRQDRAGGARRCSAAVGGDDPVRHHPQDLGERGRTGPGLVEGIVYDMKLLKAVVTLRIDRRYNEIPNDSDTSIFTAGLLGGQYIGITPGGSEEYFKDGDQVAFVQDAIVLENLISKYLFSQAEKESAAKAAEATPQPEAQK